MGDSERERLRKVSDKLMRQFAPAISTLVADVEDEDEDALLEQPVFADRIHAVFSNLAQRKPELAAFLLEEQNFEHYCLSLWHKYSGATNESFEKFLDEWQVTGLVEQAMINDSVPPSEPQMQTEEEKAAEKALLSFQQEESSSAITSTSPLTSDPIAFVAVVASPSPRSSSSITDPVKPLQEEEDEDFWSAPAPETKGALVEPKGGLAAAFEDALKFVDEERAPISAAAAEKPEEPPQPQKDSVKARLAMMLSDLDDEDDVAPAAQAVDVIAPPAQPVSQPLEELEPAAVVAEPAAVVVEPAVVAEPAVVVAEPEVEVRRVVVAEPEVAPPPKPVVAESSLQLYSRIVKDMALRESFTMDQLKFLLRMRNEKGITEQDHMSVLSDLGITPALFAQYIKNGQRGWSKPIVAGDALVAIVLDLAARLVASEDPTEQVSLYTQLVDAKRAVLEDRKANPLSEEAESEVLDLSKFNSYNMSIASPASTSYSGATVVVIPVLSPSASFTSSSGSISPHSLSSSAPPAYNPALTSSTSLFSAGSVSPLASSSMSMDRSVSVPSFAVPSCSLTSSSSSTSSIPVARGSLSSAPPPPPARSSLIANNGASNLNSQPPVPTSPAPLPPSSSAIPQRGSLFGVNGASNVAPPPPLRIPSSPSVGQPQASPQVSPLVRNNSLTPAAVASIPVSGSPVNAGMSRSPSGIQVDGPQTPSAGARYSSVSPLASANNTMNRSPSFPQLVVSAAFDPPPPAYEPPPGVPPPSYGAPPSYNAAIAPTTPTAASSAQSRDISEYWTIVAPVRIRDTPSLTGDAVGKLDPGTICVSSQRQGSWFKHSQGWTLYEGDGKVFAKALNPDTLVTYQATITVRIRTAPLPTAPEVGFLQPSQIVRELEIQGIWLRHELGWSMMTSDPAAKGEKKVFLQLVTSRVVDICTYYEALLQVRVRQKPAVDGAELGLLAPGQVVRCLEIQGPWLRHEGGWSLLSGEVKGHKATFMQQTSPPSEGKHKPFYEVVNPLRVRSAPSVSAPEVGLLGLGQRVKCLEIQGFWLRHEQGWSMIHSDPAKGEKRTFLQQIPVQPLSPPASPSSAPASPSRQSSSSRPKLEQRPSQSNVMHFEVISPVGLRVRDSPSDQGKEMTRLQPGQMIVGTDIQGPWVRHALGWSMIFTLGKKGEKIFYLKPK